MPRTIDRNWEEREIYRWVFFEGEFLNVVIVDARISFSF